MSDLFEISLRSKSAEQLLNMSQNKAAWNAGQLLLIQQEIRKRGLEIFEEPEPWKEGTMEDLDLLNPKSDFEENMSIIMAHDKKVQELKGMNLASQITGVSAVVFNFGYLIFLGYENQILGNTSIVLAFAGMALFILKKYLLSLVLSCLSLVILVVLLLSHLQQYI